MTNFLLSIRKKTGNRLQVVLFFLLSTVSKSFAGVDPPVIQVLDGSAGQVIDSATLMVEDAKFFNPAYYGKLIKPYPLQNVVSLEINEQTPLVIQSDFSVTIRLGISIVRNDSTTGYEERNFTVNYVANNQYAHKDIYVFKNCARVTVKILSRSKNVGWNAYQVVKVVNQLQSLPNYQFSCSLNAINTINDSAWAPNTNKDELPVYWSPSIGADEYDLEWTYIDSSSLASGVYGNSSSPDPYLVFDNNASRVTIRGTLYAIPLIYDNKGHLFFRVRPVQWQPGGGRNEADWSSNYAPNGLGRFDYNGHERMLNWQATTTYAEDGKRKIVIQYFDGSLRGRQTVTKDNSTNTTIVAENFYDYQGRPVIQVLPAPTVNSIIKYNQSFNVGLNSNIYDKFNYDTLANPDLYCNSGAAAMDTVSGATRYYSSHNELVDSAFHQYIPDAEGYPFTEVVYTQDNTGRISRQSGVGKKFRINSGHETKYFYNTADQRELYALFGTEVGDATHYFKTTVRDANGQYSVSYTDMHGRTIATALAGVPDSAKLDTLASYVSVRRTEKLSDAESVVINGLVMESKKSLLVTRADWHNFTYELDTSALRIANCNNAPVCYDCLYDLRITITDDCNNQKFAFDTLVRNFSLTNFDTACNTNTGFSFTFNKFLPEGNYEVTKKLSVSRAALDYYRDSVFMQSNACKNIDSFLTEQRQLLAAVLQCKPTCESCTDSLGTWPQFWERYRRVTGIDDADSASYKTMAQTAYNAAIEQCAMLCDSTASEINDIRRSMLMDLTPSSGQYANIDTVDIYSIFFSNADGEGDDDSAAAYQRVHNYLDEDGNPERVFDESTGTLVTPDQLSPEAFVQKFKLSWANALLSKHPEYCKLQAYELLRESHEWDRRFAAVDSWREARAKGYLNPTNNNNPPFSQFNGEPDSLDTDPMSTYSFEFQELLEDSIIAFRHITTTPGDISLWSLAAVTVMCNDNIAPVSCHGQFFSPNSTFMNTYMCDAEKDMAWRAFRQMYLDIKRNIQNKWLTQQCPGKPGAVTLMAAGHQPHFTDAREMLGGNNFDIPTDTAGVRQEYEQQINDHYASTCLSYATLWWKQLAPCNFDEDESEYIISQLVQICREGSDYNHPYGSSSTKPSSTNEWKSFDEFLRHYCDSVGKPYNANCNAFLITSPKPYNNQAILGNKPVYGAPDTCECDQISSYYEKYESSTGFENFAEYMQEVYKTNIDTAGLNLIMGYCGIGGKPMPDCPLMSKPVYLPPAFQCGTGDVCISCEQFEALKAEFDTLFVGVHPAASDTVITDSAHLVANRLFADFMNNRTGFSKTVDEYFLFAEQCQIGLSNENCDSLQQILNDFRADYVENYGITVAFSTQETDDDDFTDLHDLIHNGSIQLPDTVRAKPGEWYNNVLFTQRGERVICPDSTGYSIEFRMRFIQDLLGGHVFYVLGGNMSALFTRYLNPFTVLGVHYPAGLYLTGLQDVHGNQYGYEFGGGGFNHMAIDTFNLNSLLNWNNFRFEVIPTAYKIYYNDTLRGTVSRSSTLPINDFGAFGLGLRGRHGNVDHVKIYDHNGNIRYFEDFLDADNPAVVDNDYLCPSGVPDCQEAFIDYFNNRMGTSYTTLAQINALYQTSCAISASPCGDSTTVSPNLTLCDRAEPVFVSRKMDAVDNCSDSTFFIQSVAQELYKVYIDSLKNRFDSSYIAKCLQAYKLEKFTVRHAVSEFHHTLYYYDQAGNLVKTIPPAGVKANYDSLWLDSVHAARLAGQFKVPTHLLPTQYRYNTLNQVVAQKSPDGGKTEFWYDRLGRLVLSRNAKQLAASATMRHIFSYTRYDSLGRITEVGQLRDTAINTAVSDAFTRNETSLQNWFTLRTRYRHQLTQTVYDAAYLTYSVTGIEQRNLRNRVSYVWLRSDTIGLSTAFHNAIFYSYDIAGNVDTLLNDYGPTSEAAIYNMMNRNGNRRKKIFYNYDLISGKVNMVAYQHGYFDQFFQRYTYDAENRLTLAESSRDSVVWEKEATYQYYKHGPLARMVLGHQQVQGIDYAYTLQGWLKGMNSTGGTATHDMGGDGKSGGVNQYTARDAIGLSLNYFAGDYANIKTGSLPFPSPTGALNADHRPLFNGNISSMSIYNRKLGDIGAAGGALLLYNYRYDQLNRLTGMNVYNGFAGNSWSGLTMPADSMMKEKISYDANGNILTYRRDNANGALMDNLTYKYYPNTNKLRQVTDAISDGSFPVGGSVIYDIDNQSDTSNYVYDAIGNLIQDKKEQITDIKWNVYGKITEISRTSSGSVPVTNIKYYYDALGNRIGKVFDLGGNKRYTWYVRDAQGNVLSIYDANPGGDPALQNLDITQVELYYYGSSRLGMHAVSQPVDNSNAGPGSTQFYTGRQMLRGQRYYELTNHLGNVLATVTDKKFGVSSGGSLNDYYNPEIVSATDYYPFGMAARVTVNLTNYTRFGFNGKEFDWEVKAWQNSYDYGMRIYDPRIGKFLSTDPLTGKYPWYSPYQFAGNMPIWAVDLDGLEPQVTNFARQLGENDLAKRAADGDQKSRQSYNDVVNANVKVGALQFTIGMGGPLLGLGTSTFLTGVTAKALMYYSTYSVAAANIGAFTIELLNPDPNGTPGLELTQGDDLARGIKLVFKQFAVPLVKTEKLIFSTDKLKYLFGKLDYQNLKGQDLENYAQQVGQTVKKLEHNQQRAAAMAEDFKFWNITGDNNGFVTLSTYFMAGLQAKEVKRVTDQFGTTITREVPLMWQTGSKKGQSAGAIWISYLYRNGDLNSTPEVTTVITKPDKSN